MNRDEKKQWLKRYRNLMRRYDSMKYNIDEIRSTLDGLRATTIDGMPKGSMTRSIAVEHAIDQLCYFEDSSIETINEAMEVRFEIETAINQMDDDVLKELLFERYILGYRFEKISEVMSYSFKYVLELHKKSIEKIKVPT